ncbi:MAG: hypothetical protein MI746_13805 [Pseudomonadales bacterium]|nr:hypothetical protein [Pseudomonadales bacterium]
MIATQLKTSLIICLLMMSSHSLAQSNSDREAILDVVDRFFAALGARDRNGLLAVTLPGSLNISVANPVNGPQDITIQNYTQMINGLGADSPSFLERYWDPTVLIEGNIAVFWAPYDFHIEGEFSHCGIDSFQLVKREGQWYLSNLSWTRQRQGCEPSPLGPV